MAIQVRVLDTRRVPDPTGTGMGMIFYSRVAPDPNRDGYGTGIFSYPRVTRQVPDTLLPL
jgi:predicted alpha/beta hydrolase